MCQFQRSCIRPHFLECYDLYAILPEPELPLNVYLPAMALGLSRDECVRSGMGAPKKVGLTERADHRPRKLSGGEQQRVAIARALINKPEILFADEQTANLDGVSSRQILELFRELNHDIGQTIMMVTHEPRGRGNLAC